MRGPEGRSGECRTFGCGVRIEVSEDGGVDTQRLGRWLEEPWVRAILETFLRPAHEGHV